MPKDRPYFTIKVIKKKYCTRRKVGGQVADGYLDINVARKTSKFLFVP